jgi:dTDP-glucose 4,6-dehydratase
VHAICHAVDSLRPGLAHAPCTSLITYVKDRPGHDRRYAIDFSKITNELGWRPSLSFQEAIRQTVAWYLDHSAWIANIASGGYRRDRIGLTGSAG